jgi:hypothetical protein
LATSLSEGWSFRSARADSLGGTLRTPLPSTLNLQVSGSKPERTNPSPTPIDDPMPLSASLSTGESQQLLEKDSCYCIRPRLSYLPVDLLGDSAHTDGTYHVALDLEWNRPFEWRHSR